MTAEMRASAGWGGKLAGALVFGAAVMVAGFVVFDNDLTFAFSYSSAFLIAGIAVLIQIRRFNLPSWRSGIPLYYLCACFVLPLFQQATGLENHLEIGDAPKGWFVSMVAIVVFVATTQMLEAKRLKTGGPFVAWEKRPPLLQLDTFLGALFCAAIGVAATLWSINFGYYGLQVVDPERRTTLAGVFSSLTMLLDVAAVIAWTRVAAPRGMRRGPWLALALIAVFLIFYFALYSNSKYALIKGALIAALTWFAVRKTFSVSVVVSLVLAYTLLVYPVMTTFRLQYDLAGMSREEFYSTVKNHITSLDWMYGSESSYFLREGAAFDSLGRGLFASMSMIIDTTDAEGGVLGETFVAAGAFMVPRALWTDKPEDTVGNMVGHFIGVLYPNDFVTNISPTQIGEFYMNFGILGVLLGMFLWGALSHFVDRVLTQSTHTWMAAFFFFLVPLQEASLGQGLVSFLKAVPLYAAVALLLSVAAQLMRPKEREPDPPPMRGRQSRWPPRAARESGSE